jgi:hypothetical protein
MYLDKEIIVIKMYLVKEIIIVKMYMSISQKW